MSPIQNIKDQFNTPEMYVVFSDCMYMPTWEKFNLRAAEYMNNPEISIYGYYEHNHVVGIIIINQYQGEIPEIKGIAVDSEYRKHGIGKLLIHHLYEKLELYALIAETDDDAVEFYKHCGFETSEFIRTDNNGSYKRYRCLLSKE